MSYFLFFAILISTLLTTSQSSAAITNLSATSDASNVYYSFSYSGAPAYLRLYLDVDKNASSGYSIAGIGAEYLVENGQLFKYIGSGGSSWAWSSVGTSNMVKTSPNVRWSIARSSLGSPSGINLVANDNSSYSPVLAQSLSSSTPTTASWTRCASEGGLCSFAGTRQIRYGANNIYAYKTATGSIACNNATFGDPVVGVVKACDFSSQVITSPTPTPTPLSTPPPTPTPTPAPTPISGSPYPFAAPTLINPVSPIAYGAKCDGVTDDTAAFQAAINASDVKVPAGTCVINRTLLITTSNKHFECSPGTILKQTTLSKFAPSEQSNMFRIAGGSGRISGVSIVGCYMLGTNTVAPTYSEVDNAHHYNAAVITRDYVDDFFLAGNTFDRWLGQAAFQTAGNIDGGHGDQILYNKFLSCGYYGPVFVAHSHGYMAHNVLTDCSGFVENDNAQQVTGNNIMEYNTMLSIYGTGIKLNQVMTGGNVGTANYSTNIVRNNSGSGRSNRTGYPTAFPEFVNAIGGKAQYYNNTCTDGCVKY